MAVLTINESREALPVTDHDHDDEKHSLLPATDTTNATITNSATNQAAPIAIASGHRHNNGIVISSLQGYVMLFINIIVMSGILIWRRGADLEDRWYILTLSPLLVIDRPIGVPILVCCVVVVM
jgi:hypothetical protein